MSMAADIAARVGDDYKASLSRPSIYPFLLKIGTLTALISWLFLTVLIDMARDWWNDPALSQGMLIPPLAFYIAWINRRQIFSHPAIPDNRGLMLTAAACLTFLLGKFASEFFLMRFSFV